jgi:hypothetical protein
MFFTQTHLRTRDLCWQPIATSPLRSPEEASLQLGHMFVYYDQGMPLTDLLLWQQKLNHSMRINEVSRFQFVYNRIARPAIMTVADLHPTKVSSYSDSRSLTASNLAGPPRTASHATRSSARKFLNFQLRRKHCAAQPPLYSYRPRSIPQLHPPIDSQTVAQSERLQ